MKFALLVATAAAAVADASVANGAACTASKECKVATDGCCAKYDTEANMKLAGAGGKSMICNAATAVATKSPWLIKCVGRTAGAAYLTATAAAATLSTPCAEPFFDFKSIKTIFTV